MRTINQAADTLTFLVFTALVNGAHGQYIVRHIATLGPIAKEWHLQAALRGWQGPSLADLQAFDYR
jgi:hypothetical protein